MNDPILPTTNRRRSRAATLAAACIATLLLASCVTARSEVPQVNWSEDPRLEDASLEEIAGGFRHPWALAWLDDGRMLVSERRGSLWLLSPDGATRREVGGVPQVFHAGQGGLLDLSVRTLDGQEWIYMTYAAGERSANRTELARARLTEADGSAPRLADREMIAAVNAYKSGGQHFGSRIAWLPDGTMLVSIGDGGNPPLRYEGGLQREQAQSEETRFGSLLRLRPDGSIPADNPFPDTAFFSIGHRNVQGLAVDPATGRIWVSEHGSRGGDELNLVRPGENYGWPLVSHSREYLRGTPVSRYQTREGYVDPTMVWMETVAPSGLAIRDGVMYAGGLRSQALHVIRTGPAAGFTDHRVLPVGARVRDVRVGPDGNIHLLTDEETTGRILRVND